MAKSNSVSEQSDNIKAVELLIIDSLLKGRNVVIPDFGHLEIKSLGDRRTILFKSTDDSDSFLRIMSAAGEGEKKDTNDLYTIVSSPLKEEKVVNLPKVGVFRPVKRDTGEIQVSFILSSHLRKLISEGGEKEVEDEKKESVEEKEKTNDAIEGKIEIQKDEAAANKIPASESGEKSTVTEPVKSDNNESKHNSSLSVRKKTAKVGDQIVPQDSNPEKSRSKNLSGTLLFIVVVIALVVVIATTVTSWRNKKADERLDKVAVLSESVSLPSLAELHYGNSVFWIYIYEANLDKLDSPINIPKNVSLVIPDLKAEYDVDITDSMEIQRANILVDIVLRKMKTK